MGFQDSTSGGGEGWSKPWLSPKGRGGTEEVPLEIRMQAPRQVVSGASWGRQMSSEPSTQGGGAVIGGGISGGWATGTLPSGAHRGFYGGWGTRTGGYG